MTSGNPAWHAPTHVSVQWTIQEIREHIDSPKIDRDRLHELTDQMETITRAALEPYLPEDRWTPYKLTRTEARVASALHAKLGHTVSVSAMLNTLYFDRPSDSWPADKVVDVVICKMKKKLIAHNAPFRIDNVWGRGFVMTAISQGIPASYPADDTDILASRH